MSASPSWILRTALTALAVGVGAGLAQAADLPMPAPTPTFEPFFVRLGGTAVISDTRLSAQVAGVPVAGGNGDVGTTGAAYVEAGYYLTKNIAVSVSAGYPPDLTLTGTGTLAPFGKLITSTVGLPVLQATYHLDNFGPIRPYAGLGFGYAVVFANKAEAIAAPNLHDAPAFVVVGGIDYDIDQHWGVFVDVKKAFLDQRVSGLAAPFPGGPTILPVTAHLRTDPILVSSGVSYRF